MRLPKSQPHPGSPITFLSVPPLCALCGLPGTPTREERGSRPHSARTPSTLPTFHPPSCPPKSARKGLFPKYCFSSHSPLSNPQLSRWVGAETTHRGQRAGPEETLQRQANHCEVRTRRREQGRWDWACRDAPASARDPAQGRGVVCRDQSRPAWLRGRAPRDAPLRDFHRTFPEA